MDSSKTGIPPSDATHRSHDGNNAPADIQDFVETLPRDVARYEARARTITEFVETEPGVPFNDWPMFPNPFKRPLRCAGWLLKSAFCIAVLIAALAWVAKRPIASILVLGYLLEVEGRVARSGRLRDGFPLLPLAPRIGSVVVGVGLWLLPLFFMAGMVADASLIDPTGPSAGQWQVAKVIILTASCVKSSAQLSESG